MNEKARLLRLIQQLDFSMYELSLYLDTHPSCANALERFEDLKEARRDAANEYVAKYGPLTHRGAGRGKAGEWSWLSMPWPWERSEN